MDYQCLKLQRFVENGYELCPIRYEDILKIRDWRNEQMNILRQSQPLTEERQLKYYQEAILPTFTQAFPSQVLFSYLLNGQCIGYGGLTNIHWEHRRAELSFLLATDRTTDLEPYKQEFRIYLKLLKQAAFGDLKLNRLFSETFDLRPYIIEVLEQSGFRPEGRMRQHNFIDGQYVDSLLHGCLREYNDADNGSSP